MVGVFLPGLGAVALLLGALFLAVHGFSQHLGTLCVTRDTNVHKLGAKLGVDPSELLRMINGRAPASKAMVAGLVKTLDIDVGFLGRLAEEIRKDLAAK
jgi:hypothetical protein